MRAIAVIGANYGDEGKGRIVDACANPNTVVIRHNGGCQAGHTVVRDGKRHVFNQFGAGTFRKAQTYWGPEFVCNPITFRQEYKALEQLKAAPAIIYAHPNCRVTTPYDMIVNQQLELARGAGRHGSCGLGFHETVLRSSSHPLYLSQASDPFKVVRLLTNCRDYSHERLKSKPFWHGFESLDLATFYSNSLLNSYLTDLEFMLHRVVPTEPTFFKQFDSIIFEGAQGLGLDEFAQGFPHVTHSRTGLPNVLPLAKELGVSELEAIYVTRLYITRHGQGPLPHEHPTPIVEDKTNVEHAWQGKFRTGDLHASETSYRIKLDLNECSVSVPPSLAVTCIDHIKELPLEFKYAVGAINEIADAIGALTTYESNAEFGTLTTTRYYVR